jgi:hypothetical protein
MPKVFISYSHKDQLLEQRHRLAGWYPIAEQGHQSACKKVISA